MTVILGIDPGVHNLGVCLVEATTCPNRIVSWGVYTIDDSTAHTFLRTFHASLESCLETRLPTIIRIERQPTKNVRLLKIMHYIQIACAREYPDARLDVVPPSRRLKYLRQHRPDLPYDTYHQRKKSSILYVQAWLETTQSEWNVWFSEQTKKDDAAEGLLLCLELTPGS